MDLRSQLQYYPMDKASIPMNYSMEKNYTIEKSYSMDKAYSMDKTYSMEKDGSAKVMSNEMSAFELPTSQHMYSNVIYPQNYSAYKNWAAELEYNRYIYASNIRQQMMVNAQNAAASINPTYLPAPQQPQQRVQKCGPICEPTCPLNTTTPSPSPPKKQNTQGFRPLFPSKATPPVALVTPNQPKPSPAATTTAIVPASVEPSLPLPPQLPVKEIMKPLKKQPLRKIVATTDDQPPPPEKPKKATSARQKPEKVSYFSEEDYIKEITRMAEYLSKIAAKKDTNYPCGKLSCLAGKKDHDNQPVHQMCCVVIEFLQYVQLYSFSLELIMNGLPRRQPYYKMFTHGQLEAKLKHSITTRWTYQTCDVRYNLTHDIFRRLLLFNSHMENLGLKDVVKENAIAIAMDPVVCKKDVTVTDDVRNEISKEVDDSKCDRNSSHPDEKEYIKDSRKHPCPQEDKRIFDVQKDLAKHPCREQEDNQSFNNVGNRKDPDEPPPLKRKDTVTDDDEPPLKKLKELKTEVRTPEPDDLILKRESDEESFIDSPTNFKEECMDDFGDWQHGLTIDEYLRLNGNFLD